MHLSPCRASKYYSRAEFYVVREGSGGEAVKCQLEQALEKAYKLVIVEPTALGDQALRSAAHGGV